jgi:hypothetical protein
MTEEYRTEYRRSTAERIFGGSPTGVIIRLLLTSLVVGFLMTVFGVNVGELVDGAFDLIRETLRDGAGVFRSIFGYILTGAAVVIPIWLLLRLTQGR